MHRVRRPSARALRRTRCASAAAATSCPSAPGYSAEMHPESLAALAYPDGARVAPCLIRARASARPHGALGHAARPRLRAARQHVSAPSTTPTADATVDAAWDAGLRWFDTAPLYGHGLSERRLGRRAAPPAARRVRARHQGRPAAGAGRGSATRSSSTAPALRPEFDYSAAATRAAPRRRACERLGLDRVDVRARARSRRPRSRGARRARFPRWPAARRGRSARSAPG